MLDVKRNPVGFIYYGSKGEAFGTLKSMSVTTAEEMKIPLDQLGASLQPFQSLAKQVTSAPCADGFRSRFSFY